MFQQKYLSAEDCNAVAEFKTHALIQKIELTLTIQPQSPHCINFEISLESKDVSFIEVERFYQFQKDVANFLFKIENELELHLLISTMIYSIDRGDILGSGSFGTIFKTKALKLLVTSLSAEQTMELCFEKKNIAVK